MTGVRRLRVLVIAGGEPWPLNGGGRLQLHHVLKQLAQHADVTLALPTAPQYSEHIPDGVQWCTWPANAPPTPPRGGWAERRAARHFGWPNDATHWVETHATPQYCDVVLLNGAHYGLLGAHCRVPFVWNLLDDLVLYTLRDVQQTSWRRRPRGWYHAALYAAFERAVSRRAAATVLVSSVDARHMQRWVGGAPLAVIENGVDHAYYGPTARATPEAGVVAFIGSLEFPPNIDAIASFARQVWPTLHEADGSRRLLVVGRRPPAAVQMLTRIPGVELYANVPDVRPFLARAQVVVAPLRTGGGVKNKILEACAAGRPVVASPIALGGLSAQPDRDLRCATRPREWITILESLLTDETQAQALADRGRAWVKRTHDWQRVGQQYNTLLRTAAGWPPETSALAATPATADSTARLPNVPQEALCR